jgi:hypothetical protein
VGGGVPGVGGGVPDAGGGVPDAGGGVPDGGAPDGGAPDGGAPDVFGTIDQLSDDSLRAGGAADGVAPGHRTHVWPWLKRPAQRVIFPTWLAITLRHDIFSWRPLDECELAHELCHVRQWNANGVRYIPRYLAASRAAKAAGKDSYRDNAFEAEAYRVEDVLRVRVAGHGGGGPA